jgi:transcriptional regulator with XRE-family HTH domain
MAKVRDRQIAEIIARNIKRLRLLRGMTQKQLQEKAGWRYQAMVSQLEKGSTGVGPQTLRKLAKALEVDPSEFYKATADATAVEGGTFEVALQNEKGRSVSAFL